MAQTWLEFNATLTSRMFATTYLSNGVSPTIMKKIMGHESFKIRKSTSTLRRKI
jgi:hypothetical protein